MTQRSLVVTLLIIAIWVVWDGMFVLRDTELGLLTRFGAPPQAVGEAGLHLKAPFFTHLERFDRRERLFESKPSPRAAPSGEAQQLTFAIRYRITDALSFARVFGDDARLDARLAELCQSLTQSAEISPDARTELRAGGVELLSAELRKLELSPESLALRLARMSDEQRAGGTRKQAEAQAEALAIRSDGERERMKLAAAAERDAAEVLGQAESAGLRLTAGARRKNPELLELLARLDVYERFVGSDDRLVIAPDRALPHICPRSHPTP